MRAVQLGAQTNCLACAPRIAAREQIAQAPGPRSTSHKKGERVGLGKSDRSNVVRLEKPAVLKGATLPDGFYKVKITTVTAKKRTVRTVKVLQLANLV